MTADTTERKLAAILAADVVGFSAQIARDEAATLSALRALRKDIIDPAMATHRGRLVKTSGDGFIAEFRSAVDAVRCALDIQTALAKRPDGLRLRIGVNLGDVVIDGEDVLGDGVNVAARLEAEADSGGIAISGVVQDSIVGRVTADFQDSGKRALKNIGREISVWHWKSKSNGSSRIPTTREDKPSIIVLPFDNLSGDPKKEYLADGFVESITAALSRIRSFFVIARNSAFTYKGRAVNVSEVGRDLSVAYVLEGSVQQAGNRLRVTVQLVETNGGAHVWAEKYDGPLDDIFDLQDKITEQVAGALQPSIRLAEIERIRRKRPQDLGAYDYTMRAMRHVWMLEKDESATGLHLLEEALALDPDYPLALALAGWCHAQQSVYNWSDDQAASRQTALDLAQRAAAQIEDDPLTLIVLGTIHTITHDRDSARLFLERAVAIDPNSAWGWSRLGWLESYIGNTEAAETCLRRALKLSPLDPMNFNTIGGLGAARAQTGDYAGALPYLDRALRERPGALWIWRIKTVCLAGAGLEEEAQQAAKTLLQVQPNFTIRRYLDAIPFRKETGLRYAALLRKLDLPEG